MKMKEIGCFKTNQNQRTELLDIKLNIPNDNYVQKTKRQHNLHKQTLESPLTDQRNLPLNINKIVNVLIKQKSCFGKIAEYILANSENRSKRRASTTKKQKVKENKHYIYNEYFPLFSKANHTNFGRKFINLLATDFSQPQTFQQKNVKLSYCCFPNYKNVMQQHNTKTLHQTPKHQQIQQKPNAAYNARCTRKLKLP